MAAGRHDPAQLSFQRRASGPLPVLPHAAPAAAGTLSLASASSCRPSDRGGLRSAEAHEVAMGRGKPLFIGFPWAGRIGVRGEPGGLVTGGNEFQRLTEGAGERVAGLRDGALAFGLRLFSGGAWSGVIGARQSQHHLAVVGSWGDLMMRVYLFRRGAGRNTLGGRAPRRKGARRPVATGTAGCANRRFGRPW